MYLISLESIMALFTDTPYSATQLKKIWLQNTITEVYLYGCIAT